MNRKLIKTLTKEKNKLIPNGSYAIFSRGYGKTMLMLERMLVYSGYCYVISYLKTCKERYTYDKAKELIHEYVSEMWRLTENI